MIDTWQQEDPSPPFAWSEVPSNETGGACRVVAARTLLDTSRLLTGLLRLVRPDVGQRSERMAGLVQRVVRRLDLSQSWEFEVAARLSDIGCLGLSPALMAAAERGEGIEDEDLMAVASHPLVARDLLSNVTHLEGVAEMVARQSEPVALPGEAARPLTDRDRLAIGGQLLKVCGEFDRLTARGLDPADVMARLGRQPAEFDPHIVAALDGEPV